MAFLYCKIPPPLVAVILGLLAWALTDNLFFSAFLPLIFITSEALSPFITFILIGLFVSIGLLFDGLALYHFWQKKTTVNPLAPKKASALVCSGIYRFSRNPMYVGMLCYLIAWAIFLLAPIACIAPIGFVIYLTYFQIKPEECALREKFGHEYVAYCQAVRRWF